MIWTLGVSVDWVDIDDFSEPFSSVNPKFGVLWNVTPNTVLRVGVFKTLRRFPSANQTIEPTQVAGFNQFFDDLDATESVRYGAGIDHRFSSSLSGGIEVSKRDLEIPVAGQSTTLDFKESLYRAYLNWTPQPRWVATLEYFKEDFDDLEPRGLFDTETQIVPLSVSYFDPSGLFGKLRVSYLDQEVALEAGPDSDGAAFLDLGLGYRLPKRWGIFEVQFQNLLDQDYRYQSDHGRRAPNQAGVPSLLPFAPELTVFARLTIAL
jgi:outer membrane receptor protein involved in Fe transport